MISTGFATRGKHRDGTRSNSGNFKTRFFLIFLKRSSIWVKIRPYSTIIWNFWSWVTSTDLFTIITEKLMSSASFWRIIWQLSIKLEIWHFWLVLTLRDLDWPWKYHFWKIMSRASVPGLGPKINLNADPCLTRLLEVNNFERSSDIW